MRAEEEKAKMQEEKEKEEIEIANKKAKDDEYLKGLLSKYQRDDIISHLTPEITTISKKVTKEQLDSERADYTDAQKNN